MRNPGGLPWPAAAIGLAIVAVVVWLYVETADPFILVFGSLVAVNFGFAWWVARDARATGMPPTPWSVLTMVAPALGVAAYLVTRELRKPT